MQKYWVVLKVSLTRPWVWMMLGFAVLQVFPLTMFSFNTNVNKNEIQSCLPPFDRSEMMVNELHELLELSKLRQLGTIEGINTRSIPSEFVLEESKESTGEVRRAETGQSRSNGAWPILDSLPQLKSLTMEPPNQLNSEGWRRIGQLRQLETLSLEKVGSTDPVALKSVDQDLANALRQLPKLRQLNLSHTGGSIGWTLPPLPQLESVVLGHNLQLEATLETLAAHSPRLHTLTFQTYEGFEFTDRMVAALRQMSHLQTISIASSSKTHQEYEVTSQQVATLQREIPGISVQRGIYSLKRLFASGMLIMFAGFLPFVFWIQSGLKMAQPLAAVMPGHRRPHLFWPVAISITGSVVYAVVTILLGVAWPVAVGLGCLSTTLMAMVLPGHDITPALRTWGGRITTIDALMLISLPSLAFSVPHRVDAFLAGDFPWLSAAVCLWFLGGMVWKIQRMERLHRVLAESGMTGIPGLNLGLQQLYDQPYKPAPGWSMAGWQLKRMEHSFDRKIAGMDRTNWVDMLRKASPSNPGIWIGAMMMIVFIVVFRVMTSGKLQNLPPVQPMISVGALQATMMILGINAMMWVGRRNSIAADFLRPISRRRFWQSLRLAILYDLLPAMLFALVGGLYTVFLANKGGIPALSVAVTILAAAGFLAVIHAVVLFLVIGQRLWLSATLGLICSCVAGAVSVMCVAMTMGQDAVPIAGAALAIVILAAGLGTQWSLSRQLPDWELG